MRVGVPKETHSLEARVATTPSVVKRLIKKGFSVTVERGAGKKASFTDAEYEEAGAELVSSAKEVWSSADVLLKVRPPGVRPEQVDDAGADECTWLRSDQVLITMVRPATNQALIDALKPQ
jgi:H+-translocating NAD(P) transhydrogenase subunit alpha